jgi:transposase InsO family protein
MNFTEIQPSKTYQYLLVVVCTFTGWVEAYPIHMEKATEVSRVLAKEIIPWIGVPNSIRSDNRPAFVSQVIKGISLAVGLTWELHTRYHPQSSGQVERMNRTIKTSLAKQCQETGLPWPDVLPLALFKIRCTPKKCSLSPPFEVLYGRPPPLIPGQAGDLREYGQISLHKFLKGLVHASREIAWHLGHPEPAPMTLGPLHPWSLGDWVWVKTPTRENLDHQREGPYQVILTTPSTFKVARLKPWIHHTHVKPVEDPGQEWKSRANLDQPLKQTLT